MLFIWGCFIRMYEMDNIQIMLVRKDMDVSEHERLSNVSVGH